MIKRTISVFLFCCMAITIHAQQCPKISMYSPDMVKEGSTVSFSANVSGGDPNITPTYNWTVSNGTIESGQGTSTIHLNTAGLGAQSITATVDVGGFSRECRTATSSTTFVEKVAKAEMVNSGMYTTAAAFTTEANKLARDYSEYDLDVQRQIILFPGKDARSATSVKEMTRIVKSAFAKNKIPEESYRVMVGKKRAKTSWEMWTVPVGTVVPE